jgi:hypothetical protein
LSFLSPLGRTSAMYSELATTNSFHILSIFSFTCYPSLQSCTTSLLQAPISNHERENKTQNLLTCRCTQKEAGLSSVVGTDSVSELYRPSYRLLSAKLVPMFADRRVSRSQCGGSPTTVSRFLDRNLYFFFPVAPHLYSRG